VFSFVKQASWQVDCACGASAKQTITSEISKAGQQRKRFIKCFDDKVVVSYALRIASIWIPVEQIAESEHGRVVFYN